MGESERRDVNAAALLEEHVARTEERDVEGVGNPILREEGRQPYSCFVPRAEGRDATDGF